MVRRMKREDIIQAGKMHYMETIDKKLITPPSYLYPDINYQDAYAIASVMVEEYVKHGRHTSGKKVGLTSNVMRKLAGIEEPDYGIIFWDDCYENDSVIQFEGVFCQPAIEAELAFKLREDLDYDKVTEEMVVQATEYVVPCLEIVDIRQHNDRPRTIFDTVADNAAFGGYVLGDTPIDPRETDLGLISFIFERNQQQLETSCGAAILDGPAKSVAWLAEKFSSLGNPLKKGEIILAGSAVKAVNVSKGDYFCCKYGRYGSVGVKFV